MKKGNYSMIERVASIDFETTTRHSIKGKRSASPHYDDIVMMSVSTSTGFRKVLFRVREMIPIVIDLFSDPHTRILIHNAVFDLPFVFHYFGQLPEFEFNAEIWDTMVVELLLNSGRGKGGRNMTASLKEVAKRRLNISLDKSLRDIISRRGQQSSWSEKELLYAMQDADVLLPIYEQQVEELNRNDMMNAADLENKVVVQAARAKYRGIVYDLSKHEKFMAKAKRRRGILENVLISAIGPEVMGNLFAEEGAEFAAQLGLSSTAQMVKELKRLGVNVRNYKYSTLRDWWLTNKDKPGFSARADIVRWLLDWKFWDKLTTWDYPAYVNPKTGAIEANVNTVRARTLRMAYKDPNLQQAANASPDFSLQFGIEDEGAMGVTYRECLVARPGYKFIIIDLSQIEYVVLADLSEEEWMLEAFAKGLDFHIVRASQALRTQYEAVTKRQRQLGKTINFGLGFLGGYTVLQSLAREDGVFISTADAKMIVERIRHSQRKVLSWAEHSRLFIREKGWTQTRIGHRRYIPDFLATPTRCANTPVQMTAAGILKQGIVNVAANMPADCHPLLFVHDESVWEVPIDFADELAKDVVYPQVIAGANKYLAKAKAKAKYLISDRWEKD